MMMRIFDFWGAIERWVAGVAMLGISSLVFADIVSRELLSHSLPWAMKSSVYLMIWVGFLGACLTSAKGGHLRPALADKLWPADLQPVYLTLQNAMQAIFCFGACYYSYLYVRESFELGDVEVVVGAPLWLLQLVMPYSFFSLGLRHLIFAGFPALRPQTKGIH